MLKAVELSIAAPQVIALRTARMLAAGAEPGARDRREFSRMGTEKLQAFGESMNAMAIQIYKTQQEWAILAIRRWWVAWASPWSLLNYLSLFPPSYGRGSRVNRKRLQRSIASVMERGLAPLHRRATHNARRLGRIRP